jgi:hypothetical protein
MEGNAACSADCAAFVANISSGSKCMERVMSIQEVVAHAAQQTCGDSGKHRVVFLHCCQFVFDKCVLSRERMSCCQFVLLPDTPFSYVRQYLLQKKLLAQKCPHSEF